MYRWPVVLYVTALGKNHLEAEKYSRRLLYVGWLLTCLGKDLDLAVWDLNA
jgi:hypothetical protein